MKDWIPVMEIKSSYQPAEGLHCFTPHILRRSNHTIPVRRVKAYREKRLDPEHNSIARVLKDDFLGAEKRPFTIGYAGRLYQKRHVSDSLMLILNR
jgi:hypothetical protein